MTPSTTLFSVCITTSILMMVSSPSLFTSWLALELNTMAFIPLILSQSEMKTGENSIKYFLSQTLGSIMILASTTIPTINLLNKILLISGLGVKLAIAPFHAWFPSMVSKMSWLNLFILLTVQKINPLLMISLCKSDILTVMSIISLSVGSLSGITQTHTRKMMVYSSINQMGWIMYASQVSTILCLIYFLMYCFLVVPVLSALYSSKLDKLSQLPLLSGQVSLILFLNLLSLGGLPPFLGFLPKWIVLSNTYSILVIVTMLTMSLITLMFYLRIAVNSFLLQPQKFTNSNKIIPTSLVFMTQVSLFLLPLSFMI